MQTIGFIGLGVMGSGMARNLIKAGFNVVATSRTSSKAEEWKRHGAQMMATPAEIAGECDMIVTCVPDAAALEEVISGDDGIVASGHWQGLLIDCSTIAPFESVALGKTIEAAGGRLLDAPISGGRKGAEDGTLTIMVGGAGEDVERAMPVFKAMGKTIHHLGPLGAGQAVKAANQLMVAVNLMGVCEAIALVRAAGVDPRQMREVLLTGAARSGVLEAHALRYLDNALEGGFRADLMNKDLGIAASVGKHFGNVQPATSLAQQLMQAACNGGLNDLDSASLGLLYDRLNGHQKDARA